MKQIAIIFICFLTLLLLLAIEVVYYTNKLDKKDKEIINLKLAFQKYKEASDKKYSNLQDSLLTVINNQNNERHKLARFTRFLIPMCYENPITAVKVLDKFDSTMNVINSKFTKNLK